MWIMSKTRVSQCHDFAPSLRCPSVTRRAGSCRRRACQVSSRRCLGPHPVFFLPRHRPSSQQERPTATTKPISSGESKPVVRDGSAGIQSSSIRRSHPSCDARLHRRYHRLLDTVLHPELARILRTVSCTHSWIESLLPMDLPNLCLRGDDLHRGKHWTTVAPRVLT